MATDECAKYHCEYLCKICSTAICYESHLSTICFVPRKCSLTAPPICPQGTNLNFLCNKKNLRQTLFLTNGLNFSLKGHFHARKKDPNCTRALCALVVRTRMPRAGKELVSGLILGNLHIFVFFTLRLIATMLS
jgi:hypothetical protein